MDFYRMIRVHTATGAATGAADGAADGADSGDRLRDLVPALCIGFFVLLAVVFAPLFQTAGLDRVAVVFGADMTDAAAFAAIIAAGGEPVDTVDFPRLGLGIWLVSPASGAFAARTEIHGSLALLNPYALGGCLREVMQ